MRKNGSDSTRMFRKWDLYLITLLVILGLAALCFMELFSHEGKTVTVTVDGAVFGRYPLDQDQKIEIQAADASWENVLMIKDGSADMIRADCPDRICVDHRPIRKAGETIVCLPHKVVVEITDDDPKEDSGYDVIVK